MKRILILMGRYLPGHKDGGPLRTVINLTEALGDEYEFRIACLDRDHGDTEPYPGITYDCWQTVGKAQVQYLRPGGFTCACLRRLAQGMDGIYTCGFFDDYGYKTLWLNRWGRLNGVPVTVASMGTFSAGALAQKSLKKKLFIAACRGLGLFRRIVWSVTSEKEKDELQAVLGKRAVCLIAEDLPRTAVPGRNRSRNPEAPLSVAFLSRISPTKNLLGAIRVLAAVSVPAEFTVYGPVSDPAYWSACRAELEQLPARITWHYGGDVPSEQVPSVLQRHDVFLFPTRGENYGHVIFEALSAGCVPLISDRTPWQSIAEQQAGYVLPLTDRMENFSEALAALSALPAEEFEKMAARAVAMARQKVETAVRETGYRKVFDR